MSSVPNRWAARKRRVHHSPSERRPAPSPVLTSAAAVEMFLADRTASNCRPRTLEFYTRELARLTRAHAVLPAAPAPLRAILAGVGGSPSSRHATFRCLHALYAFLVGDHLIADNPMDAVTVPRVPRIHQRTLDRVDVARLLEIPVSARDRALLVLILDCGLRSGELRALCGRDVHEDWIQVQGKTGARRIPVHVETIAELDALAIGPNRPVFRTHDNRPLTRNRVYRIVRRALRASATTGRAKNGPHALRHTFGRHWVAAGGGLPALQTIMGHASIVTTMVYVDLAGTEVAGEHQAHSQLTQRQPEE